MQEGPKHNEHSTSITQPCHLARFFFLSVGCFLLKASSWLPWFETPAFEDLPAKIQLLHELIHLGGVERPIGTRQEWPTGLQYMSYKQNLVQGEGTSLSRADPYRFCSDGNPTTFSILLWSYLILSDTHMILHVHVWSTFLSLHRLPQSSCKCNQKIYVDQYGCQMLPEVYLCWTHCHWGVSHIVSSTAVPVSYLSTISFIKRILDTHPPLHLRCQIILL